MKPIIATPTHLIFGFLGAGKTTLLNALLSQKQKFAHDEKWGLLINEFGQIGIDGSLLNANDDVAIREVSGGCICCTSQLTMKIAMARLLGESPQRLIIEPTGLAHPDELLDELLSMHWQGSLKVQAVISVLNAKQWQQAKYRANESYQSHIKSADVVVINQADDLPNHSAIKDWIFAINAQAVVAGFDEFIQNPAYFLSLSHSQSTFTKTVQLPRPENPYQQSPTLISSPKTDDKPSNHEPPYRYHHDMGGYTVGGWVLPKSQIFDEYDLQKWLLNLPNYERIKGVLCVESGFIQINITPQNISISPCDDRDASKIEMIFDKQNCHDDDIWQRWDDELLAMTK